MKSIKQQYIDLQEGNMSQANFMRNLRMTLPQYVTNVTSFEDSVRILKNKGILTEADTKSSEEGKWKTVTGKDLYSYFDEINNLNGQEVLIGIDYEMEKNHELTKEEAAKIVVKNLKKNPIYYTASLMAGKEGYEPETMGSKEEAEARKMQYLDKNMGNVVDKKMGMKPVKDVEKVKKDADAKKETNNGVKGVNSMSFVAKTVRGLKKMNATGEKMKKVSVKENYQHQIADESESHNGIKRGNIVTIDSELASKLGIEADEKFTVKNFITHNEGSLTQSIDAVLTDKDGDEVQINIEYLEAALNEADLTTSSRGLNDLTTSDLAKRAKKIHDEEEANRKATNAQLKAVKGDTNATTDMALSQLPKLRERLKDMIRKELKEITGVYNGDAMDAEDGSSYMNETDIYGIAGNPEEEKIARMVRNPKRFDKYEPLDKLAAKNIELDNMLDDAANNIDWLVDQVGDNAKLGAALINRARTIRPSLVPGLKQALNLYNK